jgi:hypothetical protein
MTGMKPGILVVLVDWRLKIPSSQAGAALETRVLSH